jgi:hypothetical protein
MGITIKALRDENIMAGVAINRLVEEGWDPQDAAEMVQRPGLYNPEPDYRSEDLDDEVIPGERVDK